MSNLYVKSGISGAKMYSSNGNNLYIKSFPTFTNAYSMNFDGVNERFLSPIDKVMLTNAASFSVWIKTTSTGSLNVVMCQDNTGGVERAWNILWRGSASGLRKLIFAVHHTNGTNSSLTSSVTGYLDDGLWHHIVCTFDGTTNLNGLKMYIDGVLDVQGTASSTGMRTMPSVRSNLTIGALSPTANAWYFLGNIEEPAIWDNVVLSSTDVTNIYNGGVPNDLTSFSPHFWYRMGDVGAWNGTNWVLPNQGSIADADITSINMEEVDRKEDIPPTTLLDALPAAAAYSLRKLRTAYAGSCIRVRRSSDNAEQDIGFVNDILDTITLLSFVGANDGYVTTWYDQQGSNDITNTDTTEQPNIVNTGALLTMNGKPYINDHTAEQRYYLGSAMAGNTTEWSFNVIKRTGARNILMQGDATAEFLLVSWDGSTLTGISNGAGTPVYYKNSTLETFTNRDNVHTKLEFQSLITISCNTSSWTSRLIGYDQIYPMYATQEVIIYHTDQTGNRKSIEKNINNYYNIY